jgi:hypothetical protein
MCAVASIPIELHSIGRENFLILSQPLNQRRYKARIETHIGLELAPTPHFRLAEANAP